MNIEGQIAVVTGAASGIGKAICLELARRKAKAIALVDRNPAVNDLVPEIQSIFGQVIAPAFVGDTTDATFRAQVYGTLERYYGVPTICIPAAGITADALSVKLDKEFGRATIYPQDKFELIMKVNLMAPIYWTMEMISRIAQYRWQHQLKGWHPDEGVQGVAVMIGSVSSRGIKGQVSYSTAKAGLEGAAATIAQEGIFYGVRCLIVHPGFTDTPMVQAMGQNVIETKVLPMTRLRRLIKPEEIADTVCFAVSNDAVSGALWPDGGWQPTPA